MPPFSLKLLLSNRGGNIYTSKNKKKILKTLETKQKHS